MPVLKICWIYIDVHGESQPDKKIWIWNLFCFNLVRVRSWYVRSSVSFISEMERWGDREFHFLMISDNFSLEILIIFPMPHWHVEYLILIINKMHKNCGIEAWCLIPLFPGYEISVLLQLDIFPSKSQWFDLITNYKIVTSSCNSNLIRFMTFSTKSRPFS